MIQKPDYEKVLHFPKGKSEKIHVKIKIRYRDLGDLYWKQKRYKEALDAYKKVDRKKETSPELFTFRLGACYEKNWDWKNADAMYDEVKKSAHKNISLHSHWASQYKDWKKNTLDKLLEHLDKKQLDALLRRKTSKAKTQKNIPKKDRGKSSENTKYITMKDDTSKKREYKDKKTFKKTPVDTLTLLKRKEELVKYLFSKKSKDLRKGEVTSLRPKKNTGNTDNDLIFVKKRNGKNVSFEKKIPRKTLSSQTKRKISNIKKKTSQLVKTKPSHERKTVSKTPAKKSNLREKMDRKNVKVLLSALRKKASDNSKSSYTDPVFSRLALSQQKDKLKRSIIRLKKYYRYLKKIDNTLRTKINYLSDLSPGLFLPEIVNTVILMENYKKRLKSRIRNAISAIKSNDQRALEDSYSNLLPYLSIHLAKSPMVKAVKLTYKEVLKNIRIVKKHKKRTENIQLKYLGKWYGELQNELQKLENLVGSNFQMTDSLSAAYLSRIQNYINKMKHYPKEVSSLIQELYQIEKEGKDIKKYIRESKANTAEDKINAIEFFNKNVLAINLQGEIQRLRQYIAKFSKYIEKGTLIDKSLLRNILLPLKSIHQKYEKKNRSITSVIFQFQNQ